MFPCYRPFLCSCFWPPLLQPCQPMNLYPVIYTMIRINTVPKILNQSSNWRKSKKSYSVKWILSYLHTFLVTSRLNFYMKTKKTQRVISQQSSSCLFAWIKYKHFKIKLCCVLIKLKLNFKQLQGLITGIYKITNSQSEAGFSTQGLFMQL